MKRTLRLQRETLGSLTDADLSGVVGGAFTREGGGLTCGGLRGCIATLADCIVIATVEGCIRTLATTCNCHTSPPNC